MAAEEQGRFAIPRLYDYWYVACRASELGRAPLRRRLFGQPIVLFRDESGRPAALLDRCAHRNVPLSHGRCVAGQLECPYHGWRFDAAGACRLVPALDGTSEGKARRVPVHAVRERQGLVWVYGRADAEPAREPYALPHLGDPAYAVVHYERAFDATLLNTAENALDVPHTAFLHRGLFRGGEQHRVRVRVRRSAGGVDAEYVEAEYLDEPRPGGLVGRLLAPGGGTVTHFDRFLLPSIAQVEYALGERSRLVATSFLTPEDDFVTRMHAVVLLRLPAGARVVSRLLRPFAKHIVAQDARMLRLQTESTRAFGGERFVSTEVDVLGPRILRLLRQAERGETPPAGAAEESEIVLLA